MTHLNYTPEQQRAIDSRGRDLLVSAAAGSGKTRVLVGRVLERIHRERLSLDDFLIITFTRAAAAELRERILSGVGQLAAEHPDDLHLRRQQGATTDGITTIDGFCSSLLREFTHLSGVSDHRIIEGAEADSLLELATENTLEAVYAADSDTLRAFVVAFPSVGSDRAVQSALTTMYREWRCHPFPERWAEEMLALYDMDGGFDNSIYGIALLNMMKSSLADGANALSHLESLLDLEPSLDGYRNSVNRFIRLTQQLDEALESGDMSLVAGIAGASIPTIGQARKADAALRERAQSLRDDWKSTVEKIRKLVSSPETYGDELRRQRPALQGLFEAVEILDREFSRLKQSKHALDFSDLGLAAVRLLSDQRVTDALHRRYAEVLVDEFQDTNNIQNFIVGRLSQGSHLFMVGDVKQSIYRFRNAKPEIFLGLYNRFPNLADANDGEAAKAVLSANFRSRGEVIDTVNYYFSHLMRGGATELEYGEDERLYCRRELAPDPLYNTEFHVIDLPPGIADESDEPIGATEREASFAAERIAALLDQGFPIQDGDIVRPCRPSDIAILLRSGRERAYMYEAALAMRGIAASSGVSAGLTGELMLVMSLLSVIDNPYQDVHLTGIMLSPLYGFTPDDLGEIRAAHPFGDLFPAVVAARDTNPRVADLVDSLEAYRDDAARLAPDALLLHIYAQTGVVGLYSAMRGGAERRENLNILYSHARRYVAQGGGGLHGFVEYMESIFEHGGFKENTEHGDGVRITTTHKSKGLEFPVVLVCGLSVQFNLRDTYNNLLIHPTMGVGMKYFDEKNRTLFPTGAWLAVGQRLRDESLAEELRILYVAMTRARDKLIMSCIVQNADKKVARLLMRPDGEGLFKSANSPAEWLLPLTARHPSGKRLREIADNPAFYPDTVGCIDVAVEQMVGGGGALPDNMTVAPLDTNKVDAIVRQLDENLGWLYPHRGLATVPSKLTATHIKGLRNDDEEQPTLQEPSVEDVTPDQPDTTEGRRVFTTTRRPAFMSRSTRLTPAERGIALHLVMQYADYERCATVADVHAEIQRLLDGRFLTEQQAAAAQEGALKIAGFFASELGGRLKTAKNVRREFRFSLLDSAERYYSDATDSGKQVLLQGVCDLYFEDDDGIVVVDFKSDYVSPSTVQARADEYLPQIDAYARALERICKKPVTERILYFLTLGRAIWL